MSTLELHRKTSDHWIDLGIGRETTVLLAPAGAILIISGRDAESGADIVDQIEEAGGTA